MEVLDDLTTKAHWLIIACGGGRGDLPPVMHSDGRSTVKIQSQSQQSDDQSLTVNELNDRQIVNDFPTRRNAGSLPKREGQMLP